MSLFSRADILLPNTKRFDQWAVIACDQFTSDRNYWNRVRRYVGDAPSTIHMILPEAELGEDEQQKIRSINASMQSYLENGCFQELRNAYIYLERTLEDGSVRPGIVGVVDLEEYDYNKGSESSIRATEQTVLERIPPRKRIRVDAPLEFPHVLMLCDDEKKQLIESVAAVKDSLPVLYDFDLMEQGGHITGWLVAGDAASEFDQQFQMYCQDSVSRYSDLSGAGVILAVGDGNHSLATAKSCYEDLKTHHPGEDLSSHPARFALVELQNIHDDALKFEPIHRVLFDVDVDVLMRDLSEICADCGFPITCVIGKQQRQLYLDQSRGELAVAVLQEFLDSWLKEHPGTIDYIHGEDEVLRLAAAENSVGFLLPAMEKNQLFRGVIAGGVLPRKTFSMGHAREKRYYMEGRKIK